MLSNSAISIVHAAGILGIGRSTLYSLIKQGQLPVRKLGKRTLIMSEDLDRFISSLPLKGTA